MPIIAIPNQDESYDIDGESFIGKSGRYELSDGAVKTFMHMATNVASEEAYQFGIPEKTITLDTNWTNFGQDSNPHVTVYSNGSRLNLSGASVCPHACGSITYGSGGSQAGTLSTWGDLSLGIPLATNSGNYKHGQGTPINAVINIDQISIGKVILTYTVDFTSDNVSIMHNEGMAIINRDIKTITKLGINIGGGIAGFLPMFFRWQ